MRPFVYLINKNLPERTEAGSTIIGHAGHPAIETELNVTSDTLTIGLKTVFDTGDAEHTLQINLSDLKARPDFQPPMIYSLFVSAHIKPMGLINSLGETLALRASNRDFLIAHGMADYLYIFVCSTDDAFTDMLYVAGLPTPNSSLTADIQVVDAAVEDLNSGSRIEYLPVLNIDGPDSLNAGETGTYAITAALKDYPDNPETLVPYTRPFIVNLDNINGYMPRTQIPLAGGAATAQIQALGLTTGDTMTLRAGFRFWPAAAEKEITIL